MKKIILSKANAFMALTNKNIRKIALGALVAMLAVGFSGFIKKEPANAKIMDLYWYVKDLDTQEYSPAGHGPIPDSGNCLEDETDNICALGFAISQEDEVTDNSIADAELALFRPENP